jgi:hypothetical protein
MAPARPLELIPPGFSPNFGALKRPWIAECCGTVFSITALARRLLMNHTSVLYVAKPRRWVRATGGHLALVCGISRLDTMAVDLLLIFLPLFLQSSYLRREWPNAAKLNTTLR